MFHETARTLETEAGASTAAPSQVSGINATSDDPLVKHRFNRRDYFPKESNGVLMGFLADFFPRRSNAIARKISEAPNPKKKKRAGKPSWFERKFPLNDTEILKAIAGVTDHFFGCRFGYQTRFAVIDIDVHSPYHNIQSVDEIREVLRHAGLDNSTIYRSSESGGWHLYIFFSTPTCSADVHDTLKGLLRQHGFGIEGGTLEIFPNPGNASGYALRLPLQLGFCFLDQTSLKGQEVGAPSPRHTPWERLQRFIADSQRSNSRQAFIRAKETVSRNQPIFKKQPPPPKHVLRQQSLFGPQGHPPTLKNVEGVRGQYNSVVGVVIEPRSRSSMLKQTTNVMAVPKSATALDLTVPPTTHMASVIVEDIQKIFGDRIPEGLNAEYWLKGRQYWERGLSGFGQRSDAILCVGHYCFYGDPKRGIESLGYGMEAKRAEVIKDWLSRRHKGFSKQINQNDPDAFNQVDRMCALKRSTCVAEADAQRRGGYVGSGWNTANDLRQETAKKKIYDVALTLKEVPSLRQMAKLTGCAIETVTKHQEWWRSLITESNPPASAETTPESARQEPKQNIPTRPQSTDQAGPLKLVGSNVVWLFDSRRILKLVGSNVVGLVGSRQTLPKRPRDPPTFPAQAKANPSKAIDRQFFDQRRKR